jgi:hypothetical protein
MEILDFNNILITENDDTIFISSVKCICLGIANLNVKWQQSEIVCQRIIIAGFFG